MVEMFLIGLPIYLFISMILILFSCFEDTVEYFFSGFFKSNEKDYDPY